ncbi:MAG TPA: DotD/TraH family lipoprotein [Micavibrio sp.]
MFRHSRKLSTLSILASAVALSACTTTPQIFNRTPQVVASPDKVSAQLAEAADRASVALETLAAVEQARAPGIAVAPIENAPAELRRAITVNWVGPVEQITRTLADRAGYSFNVIGNRPVTPVVVSLDVENKPVIDVLRNIGLQMGMRADIRVDGTRRVVEVQYAPVPGVGG